MRKLNMEGVEISVSIKVMRGGELEGVTTLFFRKGGGWWKMEVV